MRRVTILAAAASPAILPRIRNHGIGEAVLVVDGDDGKALLVSDVTGERLEVGDDQVGFPFVDEVT